MAGGLRASESSTPSLANSAACRRLPPAIDAGHAALEALYGEVLGLIVNVDAARYPTMQAMHAEGANAVLPHVLEVHGWVGRTLLTLAASHFGPRFSHELFVPVGNHPERIAGCDDLSARLAQPNGRTAVPLTN